MTKAFSLNEMVNGWFVGDFSPSILATKDFEVGIKKYKAGEYEPCHWHKIATEITVVITGTVRMNGEIYSKDSIIVIEPGEVTDFNAITDSITAVIKIPSVKGDKYLE
jgi:quercetin dioxygenase-like cupin family protein